MLVCFVDLALAVAGIILLILLMVNGRVTIGGNKELRGGPGYLVGTLLILPLPITFIIACGLGVNAGINAAQQGKQANPEEAVSKTTGLLIEIGPLVLCALSAGIIAAVAAKPKKRKKKRKRPINDEYDDYEDRPVRRRLDEEEEEAEERARGSRRRVTDDEDDAPRRRRRRDEDDDEPPRRRRRDDD